MILFCNIVLHTRCTSLDFLCLYCSQVMHLSAFNWWKQWNCLWKDWNKFSTFWCLSSRGSNAEFCSASAIKVSFRRNQHSYIMPCDENRFDFRPFKRIVHPKNENCLKSTHLRVIYMYGLRVRKFTGFFFRWTIPSRDDISMNTVILHYCFK